MTAGATTRCAVVGGGPGGVLLAYLLARGGVPVTLLESRSDFDRRFRGDAIAPPVLDLLDVLGLADPLLAAVPHTTADAFVWSTPTHRYRLADYSRASAKYPYYALVPQGRLLPFLVERAGEFDGFRVEMGARVTELLRDGSGRVTGVGYTRDGDRAGRAPRHLLVRGAAPRDRPAAVGAGADRGARRHARRPRAGGELAARLPDPGRDLPDLAGGRDRRRRRGLPQPPALARRPARRPHRRQPAHAAPGADHERRPVERAGAAADRRRRARDLAGRRPQCCAC